MRKILPTMTLPVLACMAAACSRPAPTAPAAETPAATAPAQEGGGPAPVAAGETRYACDAGTFVTLREAGTAEVALPDGQAVRLSRVAGSTPAVYTGQLLYFTLDDDGGARLSQQDEANELRCTKQ